MTDTPGYICPYCGRPVAPLAYHEGAADCRAAEREETSDDADVRIQ